MNHPRGKDAPFLPEPETAVKNFLRIAIAMNLTSAVVNALLGNVVIASMNNCVALVLIWCD